MQCGIPTWDNNREKGYWGKLRKSELRIQQYIKKASFTMINQDLFQGCNGVSIFENQCDISH